MRLVLKTLFAAIIVAVIVVVAQIAFGPDENERLANTLEAKGAASVVISDINGLTMFTAVIASDTGCRFSGFVSQSSEGLYLNSYNDDWYEPRPKGGYSFPPEDVSLTQVAREHPEFCN